MKTTFSSLVTILAISVASFAATSSEACGGKKGGGYGVGFGGGYHVGGVGIHVGGGYGGGSNHNKHHNGGHRSTHGGYYVSGGYSTGGSANVPLTQTRAPAPFVVGGVPNSVGTPTAKLAPSPVPSTLAANVTVTPSEPALPKVAVGSTLVLDGQEFGTEPGVARLRVSGLSLPIEVLEWTSSSATVRLPKMELAAALKAEIEVLRADGSVASTTGIELSPAAVTLALGN